jgi:hypothetical protein
LLLALTIEITGAWAWAVGSVTDAPAATGRPELGIPGWVIW